MDREQIARLNGIADGAAAKLARMRPTSMDEAISKHERDLPEADMVIELANEAAQERGWRRLHHDETTYGSGLPWRKTQPLFRLRPSETTIWAGANGSYKSATANFIFAHLAWHGTKTLIASLELTVDDQLARLTRQMCVGVPNRERYNQLMQRIGENLFLYDFVGHVRPERAVAIVRYAAEELGCEHVLIDNLTLIVPPGRNSDEQAARFVAGLYQAGRDCGCHVHLIAHVRKPSDPTQRLTRYDIRGTGAASDMVDNVILLQRNGAKEAAADEGEHVLSGDKEPDLYLRVDKQRHAKFQGFFGFWVHQESMRLLGHVDDNPSRYV